MNKKSLLWDRKFWPLCCTQFLGAFNDNFFKNAMVILITFQSLSLAGLKPGQVIALCGGVFIFPFIVFSALAGQIADKHEKARLIRFIKVMEILIMGIAVTGFFLQSLTILMIALFLMGLQSTLFSPLKYSYMPLRLKPDRLIEANALFQSSTFLAILLGTLLGGLTIAIPDSGVIYTCVSIVFFAGLGFLFSLFILKTPPVGSNIPIQYNPFKATWNLMRYVWPKKNICGALLALAWFWFYGSALMALLPGYGKKVLGGNEHTVTGLLVLFCIGIGLGCIVCKRICRHKLRPGLVPLSALFLSVFLFDLFMHSYFADTTQRTSALSFWDFITHRQNLRAVMDLTLIAFSGGLFFVPLMTLIQQIAPKEHLSRVIAVGNIWDSIFIGLSALILITLMGLGLNEEIIFVLLAGGNLIVTFFIYRFCKTVTLR